MKDDYNTNSHYLTYTFLFRKVGRMYFLNLGVKGLKGDKIKINIIQTLMSISNMAEHVCMRYVP